MKWSDFSKKEKNKLKMMNYKRSVSYTMNLMSAAHGEHPADLIIKNANIWTMNESSLELKQ